MNSTDRATTVLIAANLIVFLVLKVPGWEGALPYLALSGDPAVMITRPWTLLTYAFTQVDFWHVTVNILWLAFFGVAAVEKGKPGPWRTLVCLYLGGAFVAAVVFCIATAVLGHSAGGYTLLGASSGVWALGVYKIGQAVRFHSRMVFNPRGIVLFLLAVLFLYKYYEPDTSTTEFTLSLSAHIAGIAVGLVYFLYTLLRPQRPTPPSSGSADDKNVVEKARRSGYSSLTEDERRLLRENS